MFLIISSYQTKSKVYATGAPCIVTATAARISAVPLAFVLYQKFEIAFTKKKYVGIINFDSGSVAVRLLVRHTIRKITQYNIIEHEKKKKRKTLSYMEQH